MDNNAIKNEIVMIHPCTWSEQKNNKDWFHVKCINQKVNIWKVCKKKHLTPTQIFMKCPYCGGRVNLKTVQEEK